MQAGRDHVALALLQSGVLIKSVNFHILNPDLRVHINFHERLLARSPDELLEHAFRSSEANHFTYSVNKKTEELSGYIETPDYFVIHENGGINVRVSIWDHRYDEHAGVRAIRKLHLLSLFEESAHMLQILSSLSLRGSFLLLQRYPTLEAAVVDYHDEKNRAREAQLAEAIAYDLEADVYLFMMAHLGADYVPRQWGSNYPSRRLVDYYFSLRD